MRRTVFALLAILLTAAAPPGTGPDAGDGYLVSSPLPGFMIGFSDGNARGAIIEQVPQDETVDKWTRMVTTQRFSGVAERAKPLDYLGIIARALPQSCPGGRTSAPHEMTVSGRPAAEMRADCPSNPETHLPETFVMLAIAGPRDMHVKQVAFRYVPSPEDMTWAETYLSSVGFCPPMSNDPACRIVSPE